ncbi:ParA family protein [uncultured Brachybacterium sp.]|uniref:ParA family protein n=1 Tax=uncultured Brachybacterium sp. TaxID=189680 RepID=UPI0026377EF5|nr:ParA family protein [uncultured Brachybacterium sp.]
MPAKIIAGCNQKGGVGKTTTMQHLGRVAVHRGLRVLLVDGDPQGNLTTTTTAEELPQDTAGLADALSSRTSDTIRDVIVAGVWDGLDVVPTIGANDVLRAVRNELDAASVGRERRLSEALAPVLESYDLILIDCGPSLDILTINALTAAHAAIAITEPKLFGTHGLVQLLNTIREVGEYYNPSLYLAAVIVNRYQENTRSARTWKADLDANREALNLPILEPPMPYHVAISDAIEASKGLDEWPGAKARAAAKLYDNYLTTILSSLEGEQS